MDGGGVFQSRSSLESAVQVDACPLFMFELQQRGKAAGTEAATQQERRFSPIGLQDIPVERFAGTAISGTGSVEKKVIANALITAAGRRSLSCAMENTLMIPIRLLLICGIVPVFPCHATGYGADRIPVLSAGCFRCFR